MIGPVAETIETERLTLEPLEVGHAEEMVHVLGDDRLHLYIGGEPDTLPDLRSRYGRMVGGPEPYHQEGWLNWIIRLRADGVAVGTVQATVQPGPRASLAWIIGVGWQGHGVASEAALALGGWLRSRGVIELTASIHPDNLASAGVARRLGFSPTGQCLGGELIWSDRPAAPPPPAPAAPRRKGGKGRR